MGDNIEIEGLLQAYLYHSDLQRRVPSGGESYEWPDFHDEIQALWKVDVNYLKSLLKPSGADVVGEDAVEIQDHISANGCICYSFGGKVFWVPTALTRFLPTPEILSSLFETAAECRHYSDDESRMCLSGSTVLMGTISMVGDLDLFEYVKESSVSKALRDDQPKYKNEKVICTEVAVGHTRNGRWPDKSQIEKRDKKDISQLKMRVYAAKLLDRFDFCKLDMIGRFAGQVGEITNIIFKHDDHFDYSQPFPSFAFQEVVVGSEPPSKKAFSLRNFGDYLFWLRDEVNDGFQLISRKNSQGMFKADDYAHDKAIKVAKRALVLAGLIGQDDLLPEFEKALSAKESQIYSLESSEACLRGLRRAQSQTDAMVSEALTWVQEQQDRINGTPPDSLDVENLLANLHSVIMTFDRLCYPNLPIEELT